MRTEMFTTKVTDYHKGMDYELLTCENSNRGVTISVYGGKKTPRRLIATLPMSDSTARALAQAILDRLK